MKKLILMIVYLLSLSTAQAQVEVRNVDNVQCYPTPHGEQICELAGHSLKNTFKHSVAIVTIDPNKSSLKHFHPKIEETYYVLEGDGLLILNEEKVLLKKGDLVVIPINTNHIIYNKTDKPLKLLVTAAKAWTPDCMVYVND